MNLNVLIERRKDRKIEQLQLKIDYLMKENLKLSIQMQELSKLFKELRKRVI